MQKTLLSIEEAARYLRVSKTSIRRWTNQGRLACLRVGVRRERRFRIEDLNEFLHRETEVSPQSPPPKRTRKAAPADPMAIITASSSRHVCLCYRHRDELWSQFGPYVMAHLRQSSPVLYIHDDGMRDALVDRIEAEGLDTGELNERGLLALVTADQAYLRTGVFAADRMVDFIESAILDRRALGHEAMMLSGDLAWHLGAPPGADEMITYEEKLNAMMARYPEVTIVCTYDLSRTSAGVLLGALCAHPHVHLADRFVAGYWDEARA